MNIYSLYTIYYILTSPHSPHSTQKNTIIGCINFHVRDKLHRAKRTNVAIFLRHITNTNKFDVNKFLRSILLLVY